MSILRSAEMFPKMEADGWEFFLEAVRLGCWERWGAARTGCGLRARPLRPDAGPDFLREEDFERVIGMAESLYFCS